MKNNTSALEKLLRSRSPNMVRVEEIIDVLWGDQSDGGPVVANNLVRKHVHKLRARGVPIERHTVYVIPPRRTA